MKNTLNKTLNYKLLSRDEAYKGMCHITSGKAKESEISAFMASYVMRPPTVTEMYGFKKALMERCIPLGFPFPVLDIVGTGGDGKNTFNISTLAAIVTAGAGIKIAKHGNYASTSISGSSDVLQKMGYTFTHNSDILQEQLEKYNLCFLHAPLFHPAVRHVSKVRKDMGMRTFFNLLGPLINPASPEYRLLGVNSPYAARLYHYLLQEKEENYRILYSTDGYDEISLTNSFISISAKEQSIYQPEELGFKRVKPKDICSGQSIHSAARIFLSILRRNGSPEQNNVVMINSAFAIKTVCPDLSIEDCIEKARESLFSGKAYELFKGLIDFKIGNYGNSIK